jgi:hypothetical protein
LSIRPNDVTKYFHHLPSILQNLDRKELTCDRVLDDLLNLVNSRKQKRQIDTQIAALQPILSGGSTEPAATPEPPKPKRKNFSAASRRKMAMAQQARWAKIRKESEPLTPAKPEARKPKRQISEEGMKRIIAATKKRWRLAKAAKAQPATAKKAATAMKKVAVKKAARKAAVRKTATASVQGMAETAG